MRRKTKRIQKGDKIGKYTVISDSFREKNVTKYWIECECGSCKKVDSSDVRRAKQCSRCSSDSRRKYKVGQIIKNTKILSRVYFSNKGGGYYLTQCTCGRIKVLSCSNIQQRNVCRKCLDKDNIGENNPGYKGTKFIKGTYFSQLAYGAKKRNLEFDITLEYITHLLIEQNFKCYISGVDIFMHTSEITGSLDRIDSNLGYIEGNVAWCHKKINCMKSDLSIDKFLDICRTIVDYNKENNENIVGKI